MPGIDAGLVQVVIMFAIPPSPVHPKGADTTMLTVVTSLNDKFDSTDKKFNDRITGLNEEADALFGSATQSLQVFAYLGDSDAIKDALIARHLSQPITLHVLPFSPCSRPALRLAEPRDPCCAPPARPPPHVGAICPPDPDSGGAVIHGPDGGCNSVAAAGQPAQHHGIPRCVRHGPPHNEARGGWLWGPAGEV